jgi:Family of unknown function (DUF5675)
MQITVSRIWNGPLTAEFRATTTGTLSLDGQQFCFTLEPTALLIAAGTYPVKLQFSPRFNRRTPWILDIPGRTAIEIHGGNEAINSLGCIEVAEKRINEYEIYDSKPATDAIEHALSIAEAAGETNTITIS